MTDVSVVVVRGTVDVVSDDVDEDPRNRGRATCWARTRKYSIGQVVTLSAGDAAWLARLGIVKPWPAG
jgi:hypothetical protein